MNLFSKREAPCLSITRSLCVISTMAFIAGCGGGGGGDSADNPPQSDTANARLSFNSVTTPVGSVTTTYEATSVMVDYGARAHLSDVGPFPESPGKGTTIMVIDDITEKDASITSFPLINRAVNAQTSTSSNPERYSAIYSVPYQVDTSITHGDLVSNIAGGFASGPSTLILKVPAYNTANLVSCTISFQATQLTCPKAFHTNAPASTLTATLSMPPIPGVASHAWMLRSPVNLSDSQDTLTTVADIQGHLQNSVSSTIVQVINLSISSTIDSSGTSVKDVINKIQKYPITNTIDAVITIGAGNSGQPCNTTNLNGCNAIAVALLNQPQTQNSTIVVGALTGKIGSQHLADYSTRAGYLADRYILASGDTGFHGNAQGTSFAAPLVAGVAAIIKQRFPTLTSAQISSIILLSADKDMNNDGWPDFSGVDPNFGHGKLSLKNALALAATY